MAYAFIILVVLEVLLRLLGFRVATRANGLDVQKTSMYEPDSVLGWKPVSGSYKIGPFHPTGDSMQLTFNQDLSRVTRETGIIAGSEKVVFIGGSFTLGWAVSDHQNFVWKLQQKHRQFDMRNLGAGGFGGYQSLLRLEEELRKPEKPQHVIYGYIYHHKYRDIAETLWQEQLYYGSSNDLMLPFVELDDQGQLLRKEVMTYGSFPLSEWLVTANLSKLLYLRLMRGTKRKYATEVSRSVIQEMQALCHKEGIEFYVAILADTDEQASEQVRFFEENGIKYIKCNVQLNSTNTVKGETHPDESVHTFWAKQISRNFAELGIVDK